MALRSGECRIPAGAGIHLAVRYPERRSLAAAVERLLEAGVRLHTSASRSISPTPTATAWNSPATADSTSGLAALTAP